MDDIRAQLDALMGQDRDVPLSDRDKRRSERRFNDENICKYYICGFCPHEEFRRTKNDCGDCPYIHDENCKRQWEQLDDRSKERWGYEAELLKWFDKLLIDLRKRIESNTERLKVDDTPLILIEDQQRLDNMSKQINDMLARAATLGEQGEVDAAQAALADAERLKAQRTVFEQQAQARAYSKAGKNLHQQVCKISGLIINNEESRLQDHHAGRNFNSWKKLHEVHLQLLENQKRRRSSSAGGGASRGVEIRSSSYREEREQRDGRRERERERDDKDSRRNDDKDRDKDRDRRRYDDRDRDRRRHDDKDRDKDRDRERRRYDDRERERGRDRDYRRRSRSRERARSPPKAADLPKADDAGFVADYANPNAAPQPTAPTGTVPPLAAMPPAPGQY